MKKLLVTLVASVLCITGAQAQEATTLVATLSHDGSLSAYYGQDALKDAYSAAHDGDIITLSAGVFTAVNMNKNITLRGIGMLPDGYTDNSETVIDGKFSISIKDNDYEFLIEGIRCNSEVNIDGGSNTKKVNVSLSKCWFERGAYLGTYIYGKISQCVFSSWWYNTTLKSSLSINQGICQNCAISNISGGVGSSSVVLQNCIITPFDDYSYLYEKTIGNAILTNCLIIGNGNTLFRESQDIHNCVGFNTSNNGVDFFSNLTNNTNKMVADRDNFFKNTTILKKSTDEYDELIKYTVSWDNLSKNGTGLFELSDDAKQIYKGNDGTVVGVWGGTMPFNYIPNNPRISSCDIVPKVDASGKLSVTIEVAQ